LGSHLRFSSRMAWGHTFGSRLIASTHSCGDTWSHLRSGSNFQSDCSAGSTPPGWGRGGIRFAADPGLTPGAADLPPAAPAPWIVLARAGTGRCDSADRGAHGLGAHAWLGRYTVGSRLLVLSNDSCKPGGRWIWRMALLTIGRGNPRHHPGPTFCRASRGSGGWRSAPATGYRTAPRRGGIGVAGDRGR
jgi:hypothetical protein